MVTYFLWLNLCFESLVYFFSWRVVAIPNGSSLTECLVRKSLNHSISSEIYIPQNSSYVQNLEELVQNKRFSNASVSNPWAIFTPHDEFEVQCVVLCAKENGFHIRVRSGGHDYEGLSYTSRLKDDDDLNFLLVDLKKMRKIVVDVKGKSAWVQSGATNGELYTAIAKSSPTLGFPGGVCPYVGIGGLFTGGGYGMMVRKYGLAADHITDARLVDPNGRILDRKSMGEDYFWAIRGGGGNTFGVVFEWKVELVDVPEIVTVFQIVHYNKTNLALKWQSVAPKLPPELMIRLNMDNDNGTVVGTAFKGLYLGRLDTLMRIMRKEFPDLGLQREHCKEMSWVESMAHFAVYPLLRDKKSTTAPIYFKAKSDFVRKAIPREGLEGLWDMMLGIDTHNAQILCTPFGGKMEEISESATPYPHRAGILFLIHYLVMWNDESVEAMERHMEWTRKAYAYMAPFVSQSPREAYVNYRDLDVGMNIGRGNKTSYCEARVWGVKYFKNNFDRLVQVKTMVDPHNLFRNEQSIPPLNK